MSLAGRLKETIGRLRGMPPALDVYVFGKHPAWPDFIDVARLPPVPASFRHFHDQLRSAVDGVYTSPDAMPRLLLWTARGRSGLLGLFPSRDGGNPRTGQFRRSPLLIGLNAPAPVGWLLKFGGAKIAELARTLGDSNLTTGDVTSAIEKTIADWRLDFARQTIPPTPPDRPKSNDPLPAGPRHTNLLERAADAAAHFVTDRSPTVLTVAAAPAGLFVARVDWDRLTAGQLRESVEDR